ncbi:MAG: hypothetical protein AABO41_23755 [Acidobacteriota bacterium]
MFFRKSHERKAKISQLQEEISAIYDGWGDEIRNGFSNPASSEAFEPERKLTGLLEQPLRTKADRMGIDVLPEWEEVEGHSSTERTYRRLSPSGSAKLQGVIRRKRVENLIRLIGVITALIAALAAIFAVLHK